MKLELPLIDISALVDNKDELLKRKCAKDIDQACRTSGFFRVTGHGVPLALQKRLDLLSREFFALPDEIKARSAMKPGEEAWNGWFPLNGELTSGKADNKEGIYCGQKNPELKFTGLPESPADFAPCITEWMKAVSCLAKTLLRGVASGLEMPEDWFATSIAQKPVE